VSPEGWLAQHSHAAAGHTQGLTGCPAEANGGRQRQHAQETRHEGLAAEEKFACKYKVKFLNKYIVFYSISTLSISSGLTSVQKTRRRPNQAL
jgi:hypothetical protein